MKGRRTTGQTWQRRKLKKTEDEKDKDEQPVVKEEPAEGEFSLQALQVEGFEFVDAVINYDDRSSGMRAHVTGLNLKTSAIEFDKPVDIEFGAHVKNNQPEVDTNLQLVTQLSFNREFTVFNLRDLVFTVMAKANEFLPQDEKIELKSNIDVSMDEQRVDVKQLQLAALGTTTLADVVVTQFQTEPVIQGGIDVQPFNAREVAARAGVTLPEMAKADALHNVGLKTNIKLQGEKLQANDFNLVLDGNNLSGWIAYAGISFCTFRFTAELTCPSSSCIDIGLMLISPCFAFRLIRNCLMSYSFAVSSAILNSPSISSERIISTGSSIFSSPVVASAVTSSVPCPAIGVATSSGCSTTGGR